MEERRFDDLTRVLGAATTRRQVLKGIVGGMLAAIAGRTVRPGLAEAAPAEVCDRHKCEQEAGQVMVSCLGNCQRTFHRHGFGNPSRLAGCKLGCLSGWELEKQQCRTSPSGCLTDACCNQQCVSLETDPNNCGACGNQCKPGHDCIEGQCQCDEGETNCSGTCVDTETDNNNCGSCGTVCGDCETCQGGECQPVECGADEICCQHHCVAQCGGGPPDPQTCECDPCNGQANGLSCGPQQVCCDQLCTSEACPEGRMFDLGTCECVCTPITCPAGQTQDFTTCQCVSVCTGQADGTNCGTGMECCAQQCVSNQCPTGEQFDLGTCACVDKCANVSCDLCQTCDPASGACVNAANNTDCGGGNVCCNGACQADCTCSGLPCSNGDCCANDTDFACCEDGCCPQVQLPGSGEKGAECLAPGSQTFQGVPAGSCCQPDQLMKLSVIDPTTKVCSCDDPGAGYGAFCAGNMPSDILGAPACSCGPWFPA